MTRNLLLLAALSVSACSTCPLMAQQSSAPSLQSLDQLLEAAGKARDDNRDEEAIRLYRRAVAEQPESEQGLWYLGTLLYESGQYTETRDVLRQFITLRPDAGPGWALLGLSEFQTREYPRALDHLQRAMARGMGDRKDLIQSVFYDVTILLTRFERYDDSMDMLVKMLASGGQQPELMEPAGLAGLRLPFLPAEVPPDRRDLVEMAGRAVQALQTQHYEEAEAAFRRLLTAYPNEPGVHFLYGAYLMQLHPNEAVPEFERELEISPSHVLARVRLAEQLISEGNFDRALALVQQAIKLEPERASAHMLAGEAMLAKGDPAGGVKELETARGLDPAIVRVHWDLLRAYIAGGRKADADQEKQAIEKLSDRNVQSRPMDAGDNGHDSSPQ